MTDTKRRLILIIVPSPSPKAASQNNIIIVSKVITVERIINGFLEVLMLNKYYIKDTVEQRDKVYQGYKVKNKPLYILCCNVPMSLCPKISNSLLVLCLVFFSYFLPVWLAKMFFYKIYCFIRFLCINIYTSA